MTNNARYYLEQYARAYVRGDISLYALYKKPSSAKRAAWDEIERIRESEQRRGSLRPRLATALCVLSGNSFTFTCAYCIECPNRNCALLVVYTRTARREYEAPWDFVGALHKGASLDKLREYWQ